MPHETTVTTADGVSIASCSCGWVRGPVDTYRALTAAAYHAAAARSAVVR